METILGGAGEATISGLGYSNCFVIALLLRGLTIRKETLCCQALQESREMCKLNT